MTGAWWGPVTLCASDARTLGLTLLAAADLYESRQEAGQ